MATTLSPGEEAQLAQTIEMFEVITQSQPNDYQSLEILKEAYVKLGRETDALGTSKRIAQAYVQMGQLSSAILEYETILQRHPGDPDVQQALAQIESKANSLPTETVFLDNPAPKPAVEKAASAAPKSNGQPAPALEDGKRMFQKLFVDSKLIPPTAFEPCWNASVTTSADLSEPFISQLQKQELVPIERSLRLLSDKSRSAFIPLGGYDVDMDLARNFPRDVCRRWCVMPFDRMSKSIFVATANPFNQQALRELSEVTASRLLYYLAPPADLLKLIRRAFH
jgi:hypothetical protein